MRPGKPCRKCGRPWELIIAELREGAAVQINGALGGSSDIRVYGETLAELPQDLYIPPNALEVFLQAFEGPLDLLLYLIRRQNIDILDIPVADITRQYMRYIELMQALCLELAAEYLLMAAMLAEIKSRMLLPRPEPESHEEEDPRAELMRRLQEYERFKAAAESLDGLPRMYRDLYPATVPVARRCLQRPPPEVQLEEMLQALGGVLQQASLFEHHRVTPETLSVSERMNGILAQLTPDHFVPFVQLFRAEEGRAGCVVTFVAVLELTKGALVELVQNEPFAPLHVRVRSEQPNESI